MQTVPRAGGFPPPALAQAGALETRTQWVKCVPHPVLFRIVASLPYPKIDRVIHINLFPFGANKTEKNRQEAARISWQR